MSTEGKEAGLQSTDLIEHPEGGRFREVFRSGHIVRTASGHDRSAITHIYFSLQEGEVSRFHRVVSDEIWNLYEGDLLRLYTWDESDGRLICTELSARTRNFCHVIPAGIWQAAEPIGSSVLVGCSVGPGFAFEDFSLMQRDAHEARQLLAQDPTMERFLLPLRADNH